MVAVAVRDIVEGVEFRWKAKTQIPIDPAVAALHLRRVHESSGGLTPEAVVAVAADPSSPLHPCFNWDDTEAAARYREDQARLIMRALVVVTRRDNGEALPPTRYFVKLMDSTDDPAETDEAQHAIAPHVYLPVSTVMDSTELRRRYVRQAFSEAVRWRRRYADIQEFAAVFEAIDRLASVYSATG